MIAHSRILTAIICLGGISLLLVPFFDRSKPVWSKIVIWIAGAMIELDIALGLMIQNMEQQTRWVSFWTQLRSTISGVAIGAMISYLLFLRSTSDGKKNGV
jgi:hypothetical protein